MPTELSPEAWAQIRHDYERTERPVEDICVEHGISSGTLRNRVRLWHWTRRRPPIPPEGPPPSIAPAAGPWTPIAPDAAAPGPASEPPLQPSPSSSEPPLPSPHLPQMAAGAIDEQAIVRQLESAVARVLPAIEATLPRLAAGAQHPREMERTARVLTALTRTLRELNALLVQHQAAAAAAAQKTRDVDAMRRELSRKLEGLIARFEDEDRAKAAAAGEADAGGPPIDAPSPFVGDGYAGHSTDSNG